MTMTENHIQETDPHSIRVVWMAVLFMALVLIPSSTHAQTDSASISKESRAYFMSLIPQKDTTYNAIEKKGHKNVFWKRFSISTNMVDWATLVPNLGVEFDLSQKPRTHWSILGNVKINGMMKRPRIIYNVQSVRLEGRKYWRTGRVGELTEHDEYVKLYIRQKDSTRYNGDSLASGFYNWYHMVRRNYFSARTIEHPRNWRAYYIGLWADVDRYSLMLGSKGKQGSGIAAGISAGWSIPLLPQKYPHEGSLDLDLGINIGIKATKYNAYSYEDETQHYVHDVANSHNSSWKVVPFPVIEDIHASLVWRFRSIKNKVSLALVDDYFKQVEKFNDRKIKAADDRERYRGELSSIMDSLNQKKSEDAVVAEFVNYFNRRRLENARILNPDTVFTGEDKVIWTELNDTTVQKGLSLDKKKLHEFDATEKGVKALHRYLEQQDANTKKQKEARRQAILGKVDNSAKKEKSVKEKVKKEKKKSAKKGGKE